MVTVCDSEVCCLTRPTCTCLQAVLFSAASFHRPLSMLAEKAVYFARVSLARSAKLPEGLYILPMFFRYFFYFIFFNGRLSSPRSPDTNGAIFTKISGLVERCNGLLTSLSFF